MKLEIVPIIEKDLKVFMLEHASLEGWDYSEEDVKTYFAINDKGFRLLKIDDEPAGCILITKYNREPKISLVSIGFFLVKNAYRGKGQAGPFLWKNVSKKLKKYICCLNSVPRTIGFYKRNGFFETQITNSQYKMLTSKYAEQKLQLVQNLISLGIMQSLTEENLKKIGSYEGTLFGSGAKTTERNNFRDKWLTRSDAITWLYLNSGKLEGYGVATICKREKSEKGDKIFYRLAPVYADTIDIAYKILTSLLHSTIQQKGEGTELYTLTAGSFALSNILENLTFEKIKNGDTFLMVNTENSNELSVKAISNMEKIIALTPLEYPHEAVLNIDSSEGSKSLEV